MSTPPVNMEDLAAFVQVVDSGSFTAAGRVLGRSTKQISRQVQRLEHALEAELLHRTTRSVGVTVAGQRFYLRATRVLDELRAARGELVADGAELRGSLRMVLPSLAVAAGLSRWLRALGAAHPALTVHVTLKDVPVDLVAGGFDLQVVTARPAQTTFVSRRLRTLSLPLAGHRSYLAVHPPPASPADLTEHRCLLFNPGLPQVTWTLVAPDGAREVIPVNGTVQSTSSEVLFSALHAGLGIGPAGAAYLRDEGRDRGLVEVLPGWTFEPLPLFAVFPRANRKAPHIGTFLEHVERGLREWG